MAGLANLCKLYGRLKVTVDGVTINYVWDYAQDKAVDGATQTREQKMASERAKHALRTKI